MYTFYKSKKGGGGGGGEMKAKKNTIKIAAQAEGQKKNVTEIEYNF
jgi:hypothetical protein